MHSAKHLLPPCLLTLPDSEPSNWQNGPDDPDMRWWRPLFSYADLASHGGSIRTRLLAVCAYPFLVPVMLIRSLGHAAR